MEPGLLVASPQMRDPNFGGAVVLLVQHSSQGALGLVVNREAPVKIGDVASHLDLPGKSGPLLSPALWGGPVERGSGFVLYRGVCREGWTVSGIGISPSRERLAALIAASSEFALCLGYAGWGPGQLDRELEEGSWVYVEATPDLLFECPLGDRYDRALQRLGVSAQTLWMTPVNE
ncbi:MAG: YqgE/AlgH family protein [Deltaproteobacteria bacterium]|nr:YqgE/AlgH family protein [Deltaproteobacteria bacterium]